MYISMQKTPTNLQISLLQRSRKSVKKTKTKNMQPCFKTTPTDILNPFIWGSEEHV